MESAQALQDEHEDTGMGHINSDQSKDGSVVEGSAPELDSMSGTSTRESNEKRAAQNWQMLIDKKEEIHEFAKENNISNQ